MNFRNKKEFFEFILDCGVEISNDYIKDDNFHNLIGIASNFDSSFPLYLNVNFFPSQNSIEDISKFNEKALFISSYEESLVGYYKGEEGKYLLVHDEEKVIQKLIEEEAYEYFQYNISGAYYENGPIFCKINYDLFNFKTC